MLTKNLIQPKNEKLITEGCIINLAVHQAGFNSSDYSGSLWALQTPRNSILYFF
jgi:hypothetical protein